MQKMKVRTWTWVTLAVACQPGAPALELVEPGLLCDEQGGVNLRLEGSALEPAAQRILDDEPGLLLPSLRFEPRGGSTADSPATTDRVVEVDPSRITWVAPDAVEVRIDGATGLEPGSWDIVVSTRTGHEIRAEGGLTVLDPPTLHAAAPNRVCHEAEAVQLELQGEGFLLLASGAQPIVTVGSIDATVGSGLDCAPLAGSVEGQLCSGLELELAPGSLALGGIELSLTNPSPAACGSTAPLALDVVMPPAIDSIEPAVVCDTGGVVTVHGGPFTEGTSVDLGAVLVDGITVLAADTIEIEIAGDGPLGPVDLTLLDPSGCTVQLPEAFALVSQPQVFHVSPPVVPAGRAMTVTALLADVNDTISDVWLAHVVSGEERAIGWTWSSEAPSELEIELPADLSSGTWQVGLEQAEGCTGILAAGFEVASQATVALAAADPPHAWIFDHTAMDITTSAPLPAGSVGFEEVPGVYLIGPEGQDRSEALLAVRYHDEQRITAVVPPQLEPGSYELLVVNPDGAYGTLADAVTVGWEAAPTIDSISPATLEKSSDQTLWIHGSNFRDPVVNLSCLEDLDTTETAAVVEESSYGGITASLSTRGFNQALCVVEVTNADGTQARWSAISITNPAQNLFPFEQGPELTQARRALAAAAGRTTSMDRWVYAMGGDQGDSSSALDSVEAAAVDAYGAMEAWSPLPDPLPNPLTLAGATTIGQFVYLLGGHDGTSPVATVHRAMVLDPLDVPWLEEISLVSDEEDGLQAGRWTYRVSALFDSSHAANPDGESLAGEPVNITLPTSERGWLPTICWQQVDDAVGYRVYRSAEPDASSASVAWLADADATLCFQDTGDEVDLDLEPLPEGSLGSWSEVAELDTARRAPCVAAARDQAPDPELFHLYVAGGMANDGSLLDSIERLDVTVESQRVQAVDHAGTLDVTLSEARWQCRGYTVDDSLHSVVEDEAWVFFAGGLDERDATGTVDRGQVGIYGELDDWGTARSMSPARAGFAHASASDFLYAFGGQQGSPSSTGTSAELELDSALDIRNWNSLGDGLQTERLLPGSAQESAVIFVLGGQTSSQDATTSTECTHY